MITQAKQKRFSGDSCILARVTGAQNTDASDPVIVTQNGEPLYVVQDPAQFEMQQEQMALLRLLSFAEKDVQTRSNRILF
ncbi:type II toxin-antitoxin system prevent-host-death family antitoxin [Vibrio sp. PP-XX7]